MGGAAYPLTLARLQHLQTMAHKENYSSLEQLITHWVELRWHASDKHNHEIRSNASVSFKGERSVNGYCRTDEGNFGNTWRRHTLEGLKRRDAQASQRALVTWATDGEPAHLALNLVLSIRKNAAHLERILWVVALDSGAAAFLRGHGVRRVLQRFLHPATLMDAVWKMRWRLLLTFVCSWRLSDVIVVDSDVVLLADPWLHGIHGRFSQKSAVVADLAAQTDALNPGQQLWQDWVRPEEHLNTGILWVVAPLAPNCSLIDGRCRKRRPVPRVCQFIGHFLDENAAETWFRVPRDGMDQRVFNKFTMRHMGTAREPNTWRVIGLFGSQHYPPLRDSEIEALERTPCLFRVRVLEPSLFPNGIHYFWRRTHLAEPSGASGPALVHANGVDPKLYFLRDRGLWYIDDSEQRFGATRHGRSARQRITSRIGFLTYQHPRCINDIGQEFKTLLAPSNLR